MESATQPDAARADREPGRSRTVVEMNGRARIGPAAVAAVGLAALATACGSGPSAPEERVDDEPTTAGAGAGEGSAASEASGRAADEVVECERAFNAAETRRYFGGKRRRGDLELGPLTVQGRVVIDSAELRERQPRQRPWLLVKQGVRIRPPVEVTLEVMAPGRSGLLLAFGRFDEVDSTRTWHRPSAGRAAVTFEACDRAGPDGAPPTSRSSVQHVGAFLVRRPGCYRLRASTPEEPGWNEGVVAIGAPGRECGADQAP